MDYLEFKTKYIGTRQDYDGKWGFQCVDLVKLWARDGWKITPGSVGHSLGYAKYVFQYNDSMLTSKDVLRIKNAKSLVPPQGAIIVFDSTAKNAAGHIAIVDKADLNQVWVLEQNGSTGKGTGLGNDAIRVKESSYKLVLGWLVPKPPKPVGGVRDSVVRTVYV